MKFCKENFFYSCLKKTWKPCNCLGSSSWIKYFCLVHMAICARMWVHIRNAHLIKSEAVQINNLLHVDTWSWVSVGYTFESACRHFFTPVNCVCIRHIHSLPQVTANNYEQQELDQVVYLSQLWCGLISRSVGEYCSNCYQWMVDFCIKYLQTWQKLKGNTALYSKNVSKSTPTVNIRLIILKIW